jgi:hypothetical protein
MAWPVHLDARSCWTTSWPPPMKIVFLGSVPLNSSPPSWWIVSRGIPFHPLWFSEEKVVEWEARRSWDPRRRGRCGQLLLVKFCLDIRRSKLCLGVLPLAESVGGCSRLRSSRNRVFPQRSVGFVIYVFLFFSFGNGLCLKVSFVFVCVASWPRAWAGFLPWWKWVSRPTWCRGGASKLANWLAKVLPL